MKARIAEELEVSRWRERGSEEDEILEAAIQKRRRDKYNASSLKVLSLDSSLRVFCIRIIENTWFDRLILTTIFVNCVVMALDDPVNLDPMSPKAVLSGQLGIVFQVIFTAECVFKVVSLGFFIGPNTYLRDGWNCLDIFIVVSGYLEYLPSTGGSNNTTVLRTFRLLRPLRALRAVGRFKNLRMLVELLVGCIPMLVNVFGLISFIFFVFGILGVQVFGAGLSGRCYSRDYGLVEDASDNGVCGLEEGFSFSPCAEGLVCLTMGANLNHGFTSFDDIASSMLIIFQVGVIAR